jgi:hypothetical protein
MGSRQLWLESAGSCLEAARMLDREGIAVTQPRHRAVDGLRDTAPDSHRFNPALPQTN